MKITSVILAAGQGTRMKSSFPKVLHPLAGRPLISYPLQAAAALSSELPVVVVGHGAEYVQKTIASNARFVMQEQQLGTAHAVQAAEPLLKGKTDLVVVINADLPLLRVETLQRLINSQQTSNSPVTILTAVSREGRGFGRILREPGGQVKAIIEEALATPEQLNLGELNVGLYCFKEDWLWPALRRVYKSPKGEYYLTDVVEIAVKDGYEVQTVLLEDMSESIGINNRIHLAEAETALRLRINTAWMVAGVTIVNPDVTYIDSDVTIGQDTIIYPNTILRGKTSIGSGCILGPNTIIEDTRIGSRCKVLASVVESAIMEDDSEIGPFGHLRKGAHLGEHVHMGNFGEVKDSYLGPGTKMGHFSYIGNATIGTDVNIGCGTVTCNFDGIHKHPTEIGDNVFIGSDTMLVAPLKIGKNAQTGAGAVVTRDVPDGTTVVGVPARPVKKKETSD
jgi:bifunctional UDP-N-acetylglucosamine pyrophosphorylase/glucosamine-1-phosphate N-acetyltransferase